MQIREQPGEIDARARELEMPATADALSQLNDNINASYGIPSLA
jgi:hypothetical protein